MKHIFNSCFPTTSEWLLRKVLNVSNDDVVYMLFLYMTHNAVPAIVQLSRVHKTFNMGIGIVR